MTIALILIAAAFALLVAEAGMTRRRVDGIPVRIHVNGTRGKSSVTAYLAAALRASGMRVQGKVTGEVPALILPDGSKKIITRRGPARVREQFTVMRRAARSGADALVLECMSIDPALQETESRWFRPHFYVLTNIRDDHREKTGTAREQQVAAMCRAIPRGCVVVSGDTENLEAIRAAAERKKYRLVVPGKLRAIPGSELPAGVFPENIALAAEVAVQAGVPGELAMKAILEEALKKGDATPGADAPGGKNPFFDAFPVNDPASATSWFHRWREKEGGEGKVILIFNTRSDRPLRTDMFTQWIRERKGELAGVYITGDHRARAYARLKNLKPDVEVRMIGTNRISGLSSRLLLKYGKGLPVVGIGNIRGAGYRVIKEFEP